MADSTKAVDVHKIMSGRGKRNRLNSSASSIGMGNVPAHEEPAGISKIPGPKKTIGFPRGT